MSPLLHQHRYVPALLGPRLIRLLLVVEYTDQIIPDDEGELPLVMLKQLGLQFLKASQLRSRGIG